MAALVDALLIRNPDAPFTNRTLDPADTLELSVDTTFGSGSNVVISGDLTVQGTQFINEAETVLFNDNYLYLNNGYTADAAQRAGLVANIDPDTANATAVAATGFVAGVAAVSNPTVNVAAASGLAVGSFIQVSGTPDADNNDGLYEVLSHAGGLITIRGVGTTGTVEDFTQNQFTTNTTVQGTITPVLISVIRSDAVGAWEQGTAAVTPVTFTPVGAGTITLQNAYENGNTITTDAGNGSVIIAGTESLQVTATGGLDVDTVADFDVTSFAVDVVGGGFSLDADAASNVTTTAADLTVSTLTSGTLLLSAAGLMDVDAAASLDVDVTGTFDVLASGAGSLDFGAASNVTVTAANLTLSTLTSGNVVVNAAADVDVDGVNVLIDATAGVSIDAAAASNVSVTGADLVLSTITSGDLDMDSAADVLVDAVGAISLDAANASNYSVAASGAAQDLTIEVTGVTDSSLVLRSEGTGGDALQITATAGGIDVNTEPANTAAYTVSDGTNSYMNVDSTAANPKLDLATFVNKTGGGTGILRTTSVLLAAGDILGVNSSSEWVLADANNGSLRLSIAAAISRGTFSAATTAQVFDTTGDEIPVRTTTALAASENGRFLFVSSTAGQAALTPPSGNSAVSFIVGILVGADGATTTPLTIFQPDLQNVGNQVTP